MKVLAASNKLEGKGLATLIAEFYFTTVDHVVFVEQSEGVWSLVVNGKQVSTRVVKHGKRFMFETS